MFLTDDQLVKLTGKERPKSQQKALNQMGIPFRPRADGHTLVLETAVHEYFSVTEAKAKAQVFKLNIANA